MKVEQDCKDACENGNVGGLAANGYRSVPERRRVQCGLGVVKNSNEEWKFWIVTIAVFNIIGLQQ